MSRLQHLTPARFAKGLMRRVIDRFYPVNSFLGVYGDFAEAQKSAPATKPLGYESALSEEWYSNKFREVLAEDYPALFWLREALRNSKSVFEIGGHLGEQYYAFERTLDYPPDLAWTILDVPSIAASGAKIAAERGATNLSFVSSYDGIHSPDIVFAAGALQYIETPSLAQTIAAFRARPRHIIVNVTPVYDGPAFVTLQNIGSVYCPYQVFNRSEFVGSLEAIGYRLVDGWNKERMFSIRFHPARTFDRYSGFYFSL